MFDCMRAASMMYGGCVRTEAGPHGRAGVLAAREVRLESNSRSLVPCLRCSVTTDQQGALGHAL